MESQCKRVSNHLLSGRSITQQQASDIYGIKRLASRINDLRDKGYVIMSVRENGFNRYGEPTHWSSYSLVSAPDWVTFNEQVSQ